MPPTSLLFIGFILYLFLSGLALVVGIPLLFFPKKNRLGKKVIGIVLISFPCLAVTLGTFFLAAWFPAMGYLWLLNRLNFGETTRMVATLGGLLLFGSVVALTALYLWYFLSRVIIQRIDNRPPAAFYDKDAVYRFVKMCFIRVKKRL